MTVENGGARPIRKILVAVGGAVSARSGLPMLEMLPRLFHAELVLIEVFPREATVPPGRVTPRESQATVYLEIVAARLHAEGIHVHGLVIVAPSAVDTIVTEAEEMGADLIALGVSRRGGLPLAFAPTVPHEVARRASCPVLLVRQSLAPGRGPKVRSFDRDAADGGPLSRLHLGIRAVPVVRIVGSVGRAAEQQTGVDIRGSRLLADARRQRYRAALAAMRSGTAQPAVELYKLGSGYYVVDGNHRVAAARELSASVICQPFDSRATQVKERADRSSLTIGGIGAASTSVPSVSLRSRAACPRAAVPGHFVGP